MLWIGPGKDGKETKVAASPTGAGSNAGSPILASPHPPLPRRRADTRSRGSDPDDREEAGTAGLEVGSSDLDSPCTALAPKSPMAMVALGGKCSPAMVVAPASVVAAVCGPARGV